MTTYVESKQLFTVEGLSLQWLKDVAAAEGESSLACCHTNNCEHGECLFVFSISTWSSLKSSQTCTVYLGRRMRGIT